MKNLLLIVADDVSAREFAFYSSLFPNPDPIHAPHLAALAAAGSVMQSVYSNPVCSGSRVALMSGRYAHRFGIGSALKQNDAFGLNPDADMLPLALSAVGYKTGAFGKWHISVDPATDAPNAFFDDYLAGALYGVQDYYSWERVDNGVVSTETGYATDVQARMCAGWIDGQTEPWFAMLSLSAPHAPWHEPPASLLPLGYPTPTTPREKFVAALTAMDAALAPLVQAVDLADTVVCFVGDNGTPSGVAHPLQVPGKLKSTCYDEGVRVPCVIAGSAICPDTVLDFPGLAWELVSACGVVPPSSWEGQRPYALSERFKPLGQPYTPNVEHRCVVKGGHKLYRKRTALGVVTHELYDLVADAGEDAPLPNTGPVYDDLSDALDEALA